MESKLLAIQTELKAPKNQRNKFGGYNFRSCKDILEAAKPVLNKYGCYVLLSDDIVCIGSGLEAKVMTRKTDRGPEEHLVVIGQHFYIKATASLYDVDGKLLAQTSAFAREEEIKKGMDAAQITGSASSYARKYALDGLFLIDDTKDSDATNTHGRDEKPTTARPEAPKTPIKPKTYIGLIDDVSKGVSPTGKNYVCLVLDGEKCYIAKGSPEEAEGDCQMFGDLMADGVKVKAEVVPAGSSFEIIKIEEA